MGGRADAGAQGGRNLGQQGDPARDTADFDDEKGPGNLRADYALPTKGLRVLGAGVYWPAPDAPGGAAARRASDHRLVWVDLASE